MTYDTILSTEERDVLAVDLEGAEWYSPAADIRDGVTPETVLSRLARLESEDGEDTAEAAEIVGAFIEKARERGDRRGAP
jgi:hypothetical protein